MTIFVDKSLLFASICCLLQNAKCLNKGTYNWSPQESIAERNVNHFSGNNEGISTNDIDPTFTNQNGIETRKILARKRGALIGNNDINLKSGHLESGVFSYKPIGGLLDSTSTGPDYLRQARTDGSSSSKDINNMNYGNNISPNNNYNQPDIENINNSKKDEIYKQSLISNSEENVKNFKIQPFNGKWKVDKMSFDNLIKKAEAIKNEDNETFLINTYKNRRIIGKNNSGGQNKPFSTKFVNAGSPVEVPSYRDSYKSVNKVSVGGDVKSGNYVKGGVGGGYGSGGEFGSRASGEYGVGNEYGTILDGKSWNSPYKSASNTLSDNKSTSRLNFSTDEMNYFKKLHSTGKNDVVPGQNFDKTIDKSELFKILNENGFNYIVKDGSDKVVLLSNEAVLDLKGGSGGKYGGGGGGGGAGNIVVVTKAASIDLCGCKKKEKPSKNLHKELHEVEEIFCWGCGPRKTCWSRKYYK